MTNPAVARLDNFAAALRAGGYDIAVHDLAGHHVLLAESPYALLAIMEASDCRAIREKVADVQAAFTRFAAEAPSARSWDLYLVVHLLGRVSDPADHLLLEEIESDTHYVRKFVRVQVEADDEQAIDRALRPVLPLRPTPQFDLVEPLEALRSELQALDAPEDLVNTAISSFQADSTVTIS
jgi:hypothetical protein